VQLLVQYLRGPVDTPTICFSEFAPDELNLQEACDFAWCRIFEVNEAIGYRVCNADHPGRVFKSLMLGEFPAD
jgi:hypothetical protein